MGRSLFSLQIKRHMLYDKCANCINHRYDFIDNSISDAFNKDWNLSDSYITLMINFKSEV